MYPQTLSRPYANAAFALAAAAKTEAQWANFLQYSKTLVNTKAESSLPQFFGDPRLSTEEKIATFFALLDKLGIAWGAGEVKTLQQRFLTTLAESGRLSLLPVIADHFTAAWAKQRGEYQVTIETAHPMASEMEKTLTTKLEGIFQVKLTAKTETNPALLGGFRATVGNRVLDCSLQSLLDNAKVALAA